MGYLSRLTETPDVEKYYAGDINLGEGNTLFGLLIFTKASCLLLLWLQVHWVWSNYRQIYKSTLILIRNLPNSLSGSHKRWTIKPPQWQPCGDLSHFWELSLCLCLINFCHSAGWLLFRDSSTPWDENQALLHQCGWISHEDIWGSRSKIHRVFISCKFFLEYLFSLDL